MMRPVFVAVLSTVLWTSGLAAGGSIAGRVTTVGEKGLEVLVGASVVLQGTVRGAVTNAKGEYRIEGVPEGNYVLVFSMIGYQRETRSQIRVDKGTETVVNVTMIPSPIETEPIVVTANRRAQSLEDVPVSVSIADASEILFRNAQTIEDALRYVSGVNVTGRQINIRGSSGYAIGVGSRVMMMLDGVPFITGDTGELIFEAVPVGQIDRIEVVKGASSALYGTSALGGVVNVITKPISESPETRLRTYGGIYNKPSFEKWKWTDRTLGFGGVAASHAFKAGDVGVALALSRQFDDGYRKNDHRKRYNLYLKAKEDFSDRNSLAMTFSLMEEYGGKFNYWQNIDSALIPFRLQRDDEIKATRHYFSGAYSHVLDETFLLSGKAMWNHNEWVSTTWHDSGAGRWKDIKASRAESFRFQTGATWLLDPRHTATFGVDGQLDLVTSDLFADRRAWGGALFVQDEWRANDELTVTAGARLDLQSLYLVESSPQLSPKLALTFTPVEGTTLRASFGRGFRVPSVAEAWANINLGLGFFIPSPGLKPERSYSYELGVSHRLGDLGSIDVALFRTDYENLIEPVPETRRDTVNLRDSLVVQWKNISTARVQGFETSLKLGFLDGDFLVTLGYTYVYPEDLSKHDLLAYRPRHVLYSNLFFRSGILRLGVDFRYISRVDRIYTIPVIPDTDERVAIVVTDFRCGAEFTSWGIPLEATFNINNVFRYNYLELTANVSPPRTFVLVLEAKL
jgi:iron complex outermembrane receptor protein